MIAGYLHQGSGLGNQLFRYVATRVKAKELNTDFGMLYNPDGSGKEEGFKGKSFMDIDLGKEVPLDHDLAFFNEHKIVRQDGIDIRGYDPEWNFIKDNTLIEGEFQDERYFEKYFPQINEWLKTEPLEIPDDVCVVGFRGGEYKLFPELYLTEDYWRKAKLAILLEHPDMKFEVHTDDPEEAKKFFRDEKIIDDIGINWRSMRYAKYAIIANSSFYILPRLLRHYFKGEAFGKRASSPEPSGEILTYAPRYWARRNTGIWALPQNYYKQFEYV